MSQVFVFADEAGNFDFSSGRGASRYFIIATVTVPDCTVGDELLRLRRQLAIEGVDEFRNGFHATSDRQSVRNRVFDLLSSHEFRVDATILEKQKVFPRIQNDHAYFYRLALYLHLRRVTPSVVSDDDELLVVGASLQVNWKKTTLAEAIDSVVKQTSPTPSFTAAFWPAATDPCLQATDYCCWAIQRKWEGGDYRSYKLIRNKIESEVLAIY